MSFFSIAPSPSCPLSPLLVASPLVAAEVVVVARVEVVAMEPHRSPNPQIIHGDATEKKRPWNFGCLIGIPDPYNELL